jgi:tripartite-type tricarboxylate transporter receptor subunit TctC
MPFVQAPSPPDRRRPAGHPRPRRRRQRRAFPTKPVTLMIPYPAGGLSDNIARRVNVPLGATLGQPVIVENLGGASGSIAAQKVLNAPSDGYMVFQGSPNELILAPLAISAIKYKPEDFRQVHRIALAPMADSSRAPTSPRRTPTNWPPMPPRSPRKASR